MAILHTILAPAGLPACPDYAVLIDDMLIKVSAITDHKDNPFYHWELLSDLGLLKLMYLREAVFASHWVSDSDRGFIQIEIKKLIDSYMKQAESTKYN